MKGLIIAFRYWWRKKLDICGLRIRSEIPEMWLSNMFSIIWKREKLDSNMTKQRTTNSLKIVAWKMWYSEVSNIIPRHEDHESNVNRVPDTGDVYVMSFQPTSSCWASNFQETHRCVHQCAQKCQLILNIDTCADAYVDDLRHNHSHSHNHKNRKYTAYQVISCMSFQK